MAFSQSEQFEIIRLLGWPVMTITESSISYSKIIHDRITSYPEQAEFIVKELIERIEALDEQLEKSVNRSNVKRIDDFEFFGNESTELRKERFRIIKELGCALDIPLGPGIKNSNCFSVVF